MYKLKQSLIAFAGLFALVSAVALLTPQTGRGQKTSAPTPLNVNVVNPVKVEADQPLPVRDAADPARRPFAKGVNIFIEPDQSGSFENIPFNVTIPEGSRLVIERVSGFVRLPGGQVATGGIRVTTDGQPLPHELVFTPAGSNIGLQSGDSFVAADSLRLYADAGTDVIASIVRNSSTGVVQGRMVISGYFVDVPTPTP